jgi:hypothetical protein
LIASSVKSIDDLVDVVFVLLAELEVLVEVVKAHLTEIFHRLFFCGVLDASIYLTEVGELSVGKGDRTPALICWRSKLMLLLALTCASLTWHQQLWLLLRLMIDNRTLWVYRFLNLLHN